ncbi:M56 family metallopeptidase [Pelomonas sp. SE-A7]|uniref:M56 family metallopeptidase n=1 Tax=Pelomonas sp. SE-A7 TaxID=3054953 RepID=UPI00259D12B4|nr:M56 family metallopeptidase [Pelomonas sp. SE-A7]MDM4767823.1 M56 family metallopeptidase [Pelomonas sp. SE-A7]
MLEALTSWLVNYLLHSTVLLAGAALAERHPRLRNALAARELLWRIALFGGLLSATAQALAPSAFEMARRFQMPAISSAAEPSNVGLVLSSVEPPLLRREPVAPAQAASSEKIEEQSRQDLPLPSRLANAAGLLTLAWALVAVASIVLLLLRLGLLHWRVGRLQVAADRWQDSASRLAELAGVRTPPLRLSERWTSPLVAPGGTVCLPRWLALKLDAGQCEAVLAHEIAHLQRRDPAWRLAGQAVAALGWLQPLNGLALRRLDELAELACDRWAAQASGRPRALAESLYACAEQIVVRRARAPRLAMAMARSESALLKRIRSLLEDQNMTTTNQDGGEAVVAKKQGFKWRWLVLGCVLSALFGAVAVPAVVLGRMDHDWIVELEDGVSFHRGLRMVFNNDGTSTRISVRGGELKFNEDEDELLAIDGSVRMTEQKGGMRRSVSIESQPDGKLKQIYSVNGKVQAVDAAGAEWIKGMTKALAESAVNADERARKLFKRGGLEAVLADCEKPGQDHHRRNRIQALLKLSDVGKLDAKTAGRLIAAAAQIDSDYERRESMVALIGHQPLEAAQQVALLQTTAKMGSDFDRRTVLEALAPQQLEQTEVLNAWYGVLKAMGSDFDQRTAIEKLMDRRPLGKPSVDAALEASRLLGSDFDRRTALQHIAPHLDLATQLEAYVQSASALGGDFDHREALMTLIARGPLDKAGTLMVLNGMSRMGSDFDLATTLKALAEQMPADPEVLSRYRKTARRLSDFERGQVEKALDRLDRG